MNMKLRIIITCLICMGFAMNTQVQAQEDMASKEIRKEINKLVKDLPVEAQLEVLKYAQRQQANIERAAAQPAPAPAAAAAPAPQQSQARPAPQPAQPQTVQVKPQQPTQPTQPNQPARPAYIEQAEAMQPTTVDWGEINHDFGDIISGNVVKHTFRFRNTGDQPLVLTRVKASCGCTTPSWSKEPIAPGEEGFIEVSFNSRGRKGPQRKTVVVNGNFDPVTKVLRFQGEVIQKEGN